ncbi:hypothetical protein CCUS01_02935, partial [Colletotrichum cuscutae]
KKREQEQKLRDRPSTPTTRIFLRATSGPAPQIHHPVPTKARVCDIAPRCTAQLEQTTLGSQISRQGEGNEGEPHGKRGPLVVSHTCADFLTFRVRSTNDYLAHRISRHLSSHPGQSHLIPSRWPASATASVSTAVLSCTLAAAQL